jgi:hypothetical protein
MAQDQHTGEDHLLSAEPGPDAGPSPIDSSSPAPGPTGKKLDPRNPCPTTVQSGLSSFIGGSHGRHR